MDPTDPEFDWLAEAIAAYSGGDRSAAIAAALIYWAAKDSHGGS